METDIIRQMIANAPNFVGFIVGMLALYRRLHQQDKIIAILIDKWENCEDDREKKQPPIT